MTAVSPSKTLDPVWYVQPEKSENSFLSAERRRNTSAPSVTEPRSSEKLWEIQSLTWLFRNVPKRVPRTLRACFTVASYSWPGGVRLRKEPLVYYFQPCIRRAQVSQQTVELIAVVAIDRNTLFDAFVSYLSPRQRRRREQSLPETITLSLPIDHYHLTFAVESSVCPRRSAPIEIFPSTYFACQRECRLACRRAARIQLHRWSPYEESPVYYRCIRTLGRPDTFS